MSTETNRMPIMFGEAEELIMANIRAADMTPLMLLGPPGCGKTTVPLNVAENAFGIPRDVAERCIFRPSLRDPVDLIGLPNVQIDETTGASVTHWSQNSFINYVNSVAEEYGGAILIIDELPQAVPMMQNALAGLLLDRFVGENYLHPNVYQVATGNRVSDKAGAGRVLSQLGNRVECHEMGTDLEGWRKYMLGKGYDPMITAYIAFDPGALEDFDPDRIVNGTMRSWEAAAKLDTELPPSVYFTKMAGRIPEGRAAQYRAFTELFHELPSADEMVNSPKTARLPRDNRGALFAAASLAFKRANEETFANITKYVERIATEAMSEDIEAMFYKDVVINKPELANTKQFGAWATGRGAQVLL